MLFLLAIWLGGRYTYGMDGVAIRRLRLALGMTQAAFAHRLGVSAVSVCGWESGRHRPVGMSLRRLHAVRAEAIAGDADHPE